MNIPPIVRGSVASLAILLSSANAQTVGAGTGLPNDEFDTAGGRINVDKSTPLTLPAGNYTASLFSYDAGIAGDVTPFLAVLTGSNLYEAIAVGNTLTVNGPEQDVTVPFGGFANFTLASTTTIYAGIASNSQNPIALDNGTGPFTDHEGGGQPASSYIVTQGGQVPPDGAFSNPNLGRTYVYSVTVVPEPTTALLAAVGALACGLRRRRA